MKEKDTQTKQALARALLESLRESALKDITVGDLVKSSFVSRQTFYYHFVDIYDLLEWTIKHELGDMLSSISTGKNLKDSFKGILLYALENKKVVEHVYRSMGREEIRQYLEPIIGEWLRSCYAAEERGQGSAAFTARFLKYSFAGIFLDWIADSMKEDPGELVEHIGEIVAFMGQDYLL